MITTNTGKDTKALVTIRVNFLRPVEVDEVRLDGKSIVQNTPTSGVKSRPNLCEVLKDGYPTTRYKHRQGEFISGDWEFQVNEYNYTAVFSVGNAQVIYDLDR